MEIIENKRQNGEQVLIDNHHFIDCVFTDCDKVAKTFATEDMALPQEKGFELARH